MTDQAIDGLVNWLQEKVREANADGALVGVSGGIDSSVVAHLIKKAFPEQSLGVIMPCKSDPQDQEDARTVIDSADIDAITVDLTETHNVLYNQIKDQFGSRWDEEKGKIGDGNLRARLRMSTLYTIANQFNYLVVGTDNAAEWYTGYFTKYGDGGVDLVPLVHHTKGEVSELAKALGVPDTIIEKKPSAGLWEGQTDENEMGTTYDKIDAYILGQSIPEEDEAIITSLHDRSKHKRELAASPPRKF
ncbi:NAD(+) synthase [Tuberibacillus sp. Marseille-P3662]|uniref:NAD(+) synthase n=1 Tax=Tuberibacillus sp. Marseille-P3662 TaxID=1965358 RepID=UPI000A1CDD07|nr:NAD(+) synthase [Tuberibacillus sp. Marseille-P3662]